MSLKTSYCLIEVVTKETLTIVIQLGTGLGTFAHLFLKLSRRTL